jgi:glycerophosphoryl diester phosphodiesterase
LLPLLYNGHVNEFHRQGPYALSFRRAFVRLDLKPILFDELLAVVGTRAGLLIDLKEAAYSPAVRVRFVDAVLTMLDSRAHGTIRFCGDWRLLDEVRARRPAQIVHYSVDHEAAWLQLRAREASLPPVRAITIRQDMLDDDRAAYLRRGGIEYFAWNLETRDEAQRAIERGAAGLISHHLEAFDDLAPVRRSDVS